MIIRFPDHREQLGQWLNEHDLLGEGAEVGCAWGGFSQAVLRIWKGQMLYMIDPWSKQPDYRESTNETAPFDEWYKECVAFAEGRKGMKPEVKIMRMRSTDGAKEFLDNALDWVYIDGNHRYENVCEDLRAWWPKVKSGGLFSGHDYGNQTMQQVGGWDCEVQRAMDDFIKEYKISGPAVTPCSTWWMIKP